jgi:hypothetical protein
MSPTGFSHISKKLEVSSTYPCKDMMDELKEDRETIQPSLQEEHLFSLQL